MKRKGNVLAVMSPKGGAGKTVTTANIAVALSSVFNKRILAIDTNITTASLGLHLNILYPKATIYDVLKKNFLIYNAIHRYNDNLDVIPASITIEKKNRDVEAMQDQVRRIVDHYDILLSEVVKQYDLVLLDSAPGFNTESLATMQVADGILLITNPEYPSVTAALKAIEYAKVLKVPMMGIVLNKVTMRNYELKKKEIEESLRAKIMEEVPMDEKIPESISHNQPVVLFSPSSRASIAYKRLAASLIGKKYNANLIEKLRLLFSI